MANEAPLMFEVPDWLSKREVAVHHNQAVRAFLQEREIMTFGQLTQPLLASMWTALGQDDTLAFCRYVGFFGVDFDGQLSYLWPPLEATPERVSFPVGSHGEQIPGHVLDLYPALGQFLDRYRMTLKRDLHGIPVSRLGNVVRTGRYADLARTLGASMVAEPDRTEPQSPSAVGELLERLPPKISTSVLEDHQAAIQVAEDVVCGLLDQSGSWLSIGQLREALCLRPELEPKLSNWLRLGSKLSRPYLYDREAGVVTRLTRNRFKQLLDDITKGLDKHYPVTDEQLEAHVRALLPTCEVAPQALHPILIALTTNRLEKTLAGNWVLRRQRKNDYYVDAVYRLYQGEVELRRRIGYICKRLKSLLPADQEIPSENYLLNILQQSTDIIRVRKSSYAHIDRLNYRPEALEVAFQSCLERFVAGQPQFSVRLVFKERRDFFVESGIPTETLLFSLMKRDGHPRIGFGSHDHIFNPAEKQTPDSSREALIAFIRGHRRPVSLTGLKREFCDRWGWTNGRLERELSLCTPDITKIKKRYLHLRRLRIDREALRDLYHELRRRLRKHEGRFSLQVIAKDLPILWERLGGYSPRTILAALRYYRPRSFYYHPPLAVSYRKQDAEKTQPELVERYLRRQAKSVPFDALKEAFCNKRGWSETALYKAVRSPKVFQPLPREYVHRATLRWNQHKQNQLKEAVIKALEDHTERTRWPFATLDSLFARVHGDLPELQALHWSPMLLGQLIERAKDLRVIENCALLKKASPEIVDFGDLIGYLLAQDLEGAATEQELADDLQRRKVTSRKTMPREEIDRSEVLQVNDSAICLSPAGMKKFKHLIEHRSRERGERGQAHQSNPVGGDSS